MSQQANVNSIHAIESLYSAMREYESDARDAITILLLEVRKAVDWIDHDRTSYWPRQVRQASEAFIEARNELERRELTTRPEEKPSCYEQKLIVDQAKRRLRFCESQVEIVKKWRRILHHEVLEFESGIGKLSESLETDFPRAKATLQRLLTALQKYADVTLVQQSPNVDKITPVPRRHEK